MSVAAGEILPTLEALEVARFQTNPNGEVLGLAGLGAPLLSLTLTQRMRAFLSSTFTTVLASSVVFLKFQGHLDLKDTNGV